MSDGTAIIHINGAEYKHADSHTGRDSSTFQELVGRVERLVGGTETRVQRFDVKIGGHDGVLMVRPNEVVSAAVVFVPAAAKPRAYVL